MNNHNHILCKPVCIYIQSHILNKQSCSDFLHAFILSISASLVDFTLCDIFKSRISNFVPVVERISLNTFSFFSAIFFFFT